MFNYICRYTCLTGALCLCVFTSFVGYSASQTDALSAEVAVGNEDQKYETVEPTVNINTAGADEIAGVLKGVGKKRAQKIVDFRAKHGHFTELADISQISGISQRVVESNRARILF